MIGRFTKMQGAGNDFILLDNRDGRWPLTPERLTRWADRRFGIGTDQFLVLENTTRSDADFRYRIFNADGGEVEQCGNGARCMTRWLLDRVVRCERVRLETQRAVIEGRRDSSGRIEVEMGRPILNPPDLPFRSTGLRFENGRWSNFGLPDDMPLAVVAVGNPHAVFFGTSFSEDRFRSVGRELQHHPAFPQAVNFEWVVPRSREEADFWVWERGVGETLACGSGVCAAAVAGILTGLFERAVTFHTRGGDLGVRWPDNEGSVYLQGPAEYVFEGEVPLDE